MKCQAFFVLLCCQIPTVFATPLYRATLFDRHLGQPVQTVAYANGSNFFFATPTSQRFLAVGSKITNLDTVPGYPRLSLVTQGQRVFAADWDRPNGVREIGGYYLDGKITKVQPPADYPVGGSWNGWTSYGDWVGGDHYYRASGGAFGSIGFAMNPITGEQVSIQLDYGNRFRGATQKGTLIFGVSADSAMTTDSGVGLLIRKDGQWRGIGGDFWLWDFNEKERFLYGDRDQLLLMNIDGSRVPFGGNPFGSLGFQIQSGHLMDNDNVIIRKSDLDGGEYLISEGTAGFVPLNSRVSGLPTGGRFTSMTVDRVTQSIYGVYRVGNGPRQSFRLDPVPERGTLAALGLGIAAMLRRRRKG